MLAPVFLNNCPHKKMFLGTDGTLLVAKKSRPSPPVKGRYLVQGLQGLFCPSPLHPFGCFSCHAFCVHPYQDSIAWLFLYLFSKVKPSRDVLPQPTKQKARQEKTTPKLFNIRRHYSTAYFKRFKYLDFRLSYNSPMLNSRTPTLVPQSQKHFRVGANHALNFGAVPAPQYRSATLYCCAFPKIQNFPLPINNPTKTLIKGSHPPLCKAKMNF